MLKFLRKLAAPVLAGVDALNAKLEPFTDPDYASAPLPPLDTLLFKLATTRDACHAGLSRFVKDGAFFWDVDPNDLGDNCLWQGVHLAYLSLLGDIGGVNRALVEAMIPLSSLGAPGRLLRGVARQETFPMPDGKPHYFTKDGWVGLSDPSMGSLLGFCYGLTYAKLSPKTAHLVDKALITQMAARVADTLVADGYWLLNHDGSKSRYGDMRPSPTQSPARLLGLLALLKLAGKEQLYKKIYDEASPVLEYGETHVVIPGLDKWSFTPWYLHHLAFLTYDMLLMLETDPAKRKPYIAGLKRMWDKDKKWWNPYFTAVAAKHIAVDDRDYNLALYGLFDYTYPAIKTTPKLNSSRPEIAKVKYDGVVYAERALRVSERPPSNYLWQRSPYRLDGNPLAAYSGLDFLFPYSMFSVYTSDRLNSRIGG